MEPHTRKRLLEVWKYHYYPSSITCIINSWFPYITKIHISPGKSANELHIWKYPACDLTQLWELGSNHIAQNISCHLCDTSKQYIFEKSHVLVYVYVYIYIHILRRLWSTHFTNFPQTGPNHNIFRVLPVHCACVCILPWMRSGPTFMDWLQSQHG